jgi:amidase
MSTSLDGLELGFRSLLSTEPWIRDPAVVPIPWRKQILDSISARVGLGGKAKDRPLKLGIFRRDASVEPHPPVRRGLKMVAEAVDGAGHSVVDWVPPKQSTAKRVHVSFLLADGAHDVHSHLDRSGEPLIPELQDLFQLRDADSLLKYQDLTLQGQAYQDDYSDYWNKTGDTKGKT